MEDEAEEINKLISEKYSDRDLSLEQSLELLNLVSAHIKVLKDGLIDDLKNAHGQ